MLNSDAQGYGGSGVGNMGGIEAVEQESDLACREAFADFIGVPYEKSTLYFSTLYPTEDTWDSDDDRTTLCVVVADEPMTESLKGAGI